MDTEKAIQGLIAQQVESADFILYGIDTRNFTPAARENWKALVELGDTSYLDYEVANLKENNGYLLKAINWRAANHKPIDRRAVGNFNERLKKARQRIALKRRSNQPDKPHVADMQDAATWGEVGGTAWEDFYMYDEDVLEDVPMPESMDKS